VGTSRRSPLAYFPYFRAISLFRRDRGLLRPIPHRVRTITTAEIQRAAARSLLRSEQGCARKARAGESKPIIASIGRRSALAETLPRVGAPGCRPGRAGISVFAVAFISRAQARAGNWGDRLTNESYGRKMRKHHISPQRKKSSLPDALIGGGVSLQGPKTWLGRDAWNLRKGQSQTQATQRETN
jgi:hypothetical protein